MPYTGAGDDGFLKTVEISSSGEISDEELDSLEYDPVKGKTPDIIHISGDVYAIAYAADGDDGWLVTVTIATNGQITNPVIDTLEFDTSNGDEPILLPISGDVYAIAYRGPDDDGTLKTVTIATDGQITNSVIDTFEFDAVTGKGPSIISIADDVYAIAYEGIGSDGFLVPVTIATYSQWHRVGRYVNIYLVVF